MGKKKDEKKWLQVGNFLLGVDSNAHGSYVVLKSVAQNWSVRWREDTLMFGMMMNVMRQSAENDGACEYLHSLAAIMFATTTYLHDLVAASTLKTMPFCEGVAKLLKEQQEFEESIAGKPQEASGAEEEAALREVGEMEAIKEALGETAGEPTGTVADAAGEPTGTVAKDVVNDIEPVNDEVLNG